MLANERQRQDRSLLQTSKIKDIFKTSTSGTLSPMTTATTSSGYSTGGSSTSTAVISSMKKSSSIGLKKQFPQQQQQQQQASSKTKPKGLQHLFSKLKNLLLSPKSKHGRIMRPITSRRISSTNILRQYHQQSTLYDVHPSSLTTSKTISLPFTYYHDSPIRQSQTNFEQISAWLNHAEEVTEVTRDSHPIPFSRQHRKPTMSSLSSADTDQPKITVVMKQTPTNIKPPKRSSSLVTKQTRPIIEQQHSQRSSSPTLSFSSSILTKGMSERITPSSQKSDEAQTKANRRRAIDFTRRRTVAGTGERNTDKENLHVKHQSKPTQDAYRFTPSSSNHQMEIQPAAAKHTITKKYYFHSPANEDLLNNSYGLTLLQQQQQQPQKPLQQRHSVAAVLMISQLPKKIIAVPVPPPVPVPDSLDDLLCDREVESYFYPVTSSLHSDHVYMNVTNPPNQYYSSADSASTYIHGTLC